MKNVDSKSSPDSKISSRTSRPPLDPSFRSRILAAFSPFIFLSFAFFGFVSSNSTGVTFSFSQSAQAADGDSIRNLEAEDREKEAKRAKEAGELPMGDFSPEYRQMINQSRENSNSENEEARRRRDKSLNSATKHL